MFTLTKENAAEHQKARLAMNKASEAHAKQDYATAAASYEEAGDSYHKATDSSNSEIAYSNAASEYYNLGCQQKKAGDLDSAISSFEKAKTYKSTDKLTADISYNLAVTLLANNKPDDAETELKTLLAKNLPEKDFASSFHLNTYCQLIKSQEQQGKIADIDVVKEAKTFFDGMTNAQQGEKSNIDDFAYINATSTRSIIKYLGDKNFADATQFLSEAEKDTPGSAAVILEAVESDAVFQYKDKADIKGSLHALLYIHDAFIASLIADVSGLAVHAKSQAEIIAETEGNKALAESILLGTCDHKMIDAAAF